MFQKLILTVVFIVLSHLGFSQSFLGWQLHDRYFSIYAGTGWTGYIGELTNGKPFSNDLSHFNLGIEARLYSKIGARIQATTYRLEGSDTNAADSSFNRQRNLSFHSQNIEWQFQAVYYFLKYRKKYHRRRTYEPYVAIGFGQTFYNPKADYQDETFDLRNIGTETQSYKNSAWIIPASLGIKAAINEFLNLSMDIGYRYAFTGYLDDVSNSLAGPFPDGTIESNLSNRKFQIPVVNQEAFDQLVPGASRGNGGNDSYFLINFNIELYLPGDLFRSKNKTGTNKKEKIWGKPSGYDR